MIRVRYHRSVSPSSRALTRPAFLMVKLGEWTAARFVERLAPLGLRPRHLGAMHLISERPRSQLELAQTIRVAASVVVDMIDELEAIGAVRRKPDPADRRRFSVELTDQGRNLLMAADTVSREVEAELLAGLDPTLRRPLTRALRELGRSRGILKPTHPPSPVPTSDSQAFPSRRAATS